MPTTTSPRPSPLLDRRGAVATGLFVAVVVVHLVAQVSGPAGLRVWSQVAAMPLLALALAFLARRPFSRLVGWMIVGIGFSWLGDSAPKIAGEHSFLVMVGFFLLAQIAFVTAFWPERSRSVASPGSRAWPVPLLAYLVALVVFLVLCLPGTGVLTVPVVGYGLVLVGMAVLATAIHPLAALGGILFVLSDALIALREFTDWYALPGHGFAVMSTYLVAQALLVAGVLRREHLSQVPSTADEWERGGLAAGEVAHAD